MWIDAVSPKATIESQAQLSGMALLGDGKTVLFGIDDATRAVAYRVTENGRVDGSFGKAGRAIIWHRLWVGGNLIYPGHVAAFPDGRVVYSAQELRCDFSGTPCDRAWRFARTDPSGHLDLAFGDAGTSKLSWSSETQATADLDFGADVTVDAAGGVLASGTVNVAPEGAVVIQRGVVVRLAENGKPDPAFGANGTAVLSPARAADDTTGAGVLSASADGSSFVFSMSCKADATRWLTQPSCSGEDTELHSVVKLSATGAVDPSWGAGGVATAQPTANRVLGRAAAITTASDRLFVASLVYPKSENARDAYGLIALIR
jgi:uncharacterized delta-60 repeat protein